MSLVGVALRMAAVRALASAGTIAEDRIFDSAMTPVESMIQERPTPFVVVSTEMETSKPNARDISNGDGEIDLVIEVALARVVPLPGRDNSGNDIQVDLFEADASLEVCLAILRRQVMGCLFGRGGGAWGDVFRRFVGAINEISVVRSGQSKNGSRFAGRQIVITIKAMAEPPFGAVQDGSPWQAFLAALDADPVTASLRNALRTAIEAQPMDWPDVYTATAVLAGYTEAEAEAIGLARLAGGEAGVAVQGTLYPDGFTATEGTIAEQLP